MNLPITHLTNTRASFNDGELMLIADGAIVTTAIDLADAPALINNLIDLVDADKCYRIGCACDKPHFWGSGR